MLVLVSVFTMFHCSLSVSTLRSNESLFTIQLTE